MFSGMELLGYMIVFAVGALIGVYMGLELGFDNGYHYCVEKSMFSEFDKKEE